jgi:cyclohexanone monooxygenase
MGANVPGKPRVFLMYIGGLDRYVERVEAIVDQGYEGFTFSGGSTRMSRDVVPASAGTGR